MIVIKLTGIQVEAMMDTGSNVTTISEDLFVEQFRERLCLCPNDMFFKLRGVSGEELPMLGYVIADLEVGEETVLEAVIMVVKNPITPFLVGMNVLTRLKSPPFPLGPRPATSFQIRSPPIQEIVPPHTVLHVIATAGPSDISLPVLVEAPEDSLDGLCPLPIFSSITSGKIRVPIANLTDQSLIIPAKSIIGVAHVAAAEHVQIIQGQPEQAETEPDWTRLEINPDLEPGQKAQLDALLKKYQHCFAWSDMDFGFTNKVQHRIHLIDDTPQARPFRRIPPSALTEVKAHIDDLLDKGVIEPSASEYAAPIVVVRKKSGEIRLCCDYRALNAVTRRDSFPLPRIDDCLDALGGSSFFSTLDLKSGYHQVPVAPEDQHKTAFICPFGLYQWRRLPFGLSGAPMTFQRVMNQIMSDLIFKLVLVYLDDLLVFSSSFERHLHALEQVLGKIAEEGLKINPEKCQFAQSKVSFLGHQVSTAGIGPDPAKIDAVLNFPVPKTAKDVRSFVGLASYYRRFVKNFSKKAAPLNQLLPQVHERDSTDRQKGERKPLLELWTPECRAAFQQLKAELCSSEVLAHPNFNEEFIVDLDASNLGLGAVLSQKQPDGRTKVIAYASRSLRKSEKNMDNYSSQKLELCALRWAVCEKFRPYLLGHKFIAYTDNNPLAHISTAKFGAVEQRWVADLSPFDMTVKYRPGRVNRNADTLSRYPVEPPGKDEEKVHAVSQVKATLPCTSYPPPLSLVPPEIPMVCAPVRAVTVPQVEMLDPTEVATSQKSDPDIGPIYATLKNPKQKFSQKDWSSSAKALYRVRATLFWDGDVLKRRRKSADGVQHELVVLPKTHRQTAIELAHDRTGHQGSERTEALLRLRCYWPHMEVDVAQHIKTCRGCQISKRPSNPIYRQPGHLTAREPLEVVAMDFLTLDKAANGTENVLVFTDVFTKFAVAIATKDQTAATVVHHLMTAWIPHYGVPLRLHSDRGKSFEAAILTKLCSAYNIKQSRTTPRHPSGNGQVERFNRTLINLLRSLEEEEKCQWPRYLAEATFFYNSTPHATTGQSPYTMLFGRQPRLPLDIFLNSDLQPSSTAEDKLKSHLERLEVLRQVARDRTEKRHAAEDTNRPVKTRVTPLQPGDKVLLADHPLGRHKLANCYKDVIYTVVGTPETTGHGYFTITGPDGKQRNVTDGEIRLYLERPSQIPIAQKPLPPKQVPSTDSSVETDGYHYYTYLSQPVQNVTFPNPAPTPPVSTTHSVMRPPVSTTRPVMRPPVCRTVTLPRQIPNPPAANQTLPVIRRSQRARREPNRLIDNM